MLEGIEDLTVEAIRIGVGSNEAKGASASIMYSVPQEHRDWLLKLIADGLTTDDALEVIAKSIALRTDKVTRESRPEIENPFRRS